MKHEDVDEKLILNGAKESTTHSTESFTIKKPNPPSLAIREGRLLSIDVFRGLTLVFMVLVNSPGHPEFAYPPLKHAPWNFWTPTDLVFPLFIFIVGVAIPYSLDRRRLAVENRSGSLYLQIIRRSVLLFLLGLFLHGYPYFDFSTIRIMGILQRIGIVYLMGSMLYLWLNPRQLAITAGIITIAYFILMKFVPVPGVGAGVLEPVGNWGQFIDSKIMPGHLGNKTWEAKSLLGNIPALASALIGVLAGITLRSDKTAQEKIIRFFFAGNVLIVFGLIWDAWFPINQDLWSSSLILFTGGISLVMLASCYWLVDVRKSTWWTKPFVIFGVNSILVWVGSKMGIRTLEVIKVSQANGSATDLKTWIWQNIYAPWAGDLHGSEAFAITYVLLWFGILAFLYSRRIFLKV